MRWKNPRLRTFRALPALLLAVFLGAQFELVGHLHAADNPVADCPQCQFDNGQAALPAGSAGPVGAAVGERLEGPRTPAPHLVRYRLNARGPPTFS